MNIYSLSKSSPSLGNVLNLIAKTHTDVHHTYVFTHTYRYTQINTMYKCN